MSGFLDTSVVVRYLLGSPPHMFEEAANIIDGKDNLRITDVVLAETAYVLTSVYRVPRATVVDRLLALVQRRNITPFGLNKGAVLQALLLCQPSGRVSFADAMIWAAACSSPDKVVYSFDRRFPGKGIEVRRER